MSENATDAPLGRVRLLKDVCLIQDANFMKAGEIRDIVRSPAPRFEHYTWVKGPIWTVRLLDGEWEKIEGACKDCNSAGCQSNGCIWPK